LTSWVHGKHLNDDRAIVRKGLADGLEGFAPQTSTTIRTFNEELTKIDVHSIGNIVVSSDLMQRVPYNDVVLL
jgi:hypothetical protein